MTIPSEHESYTDAGIKQEAGKRIAGDATNADAISAESKERISADAILRRLSADGVIIPKQYVWLSAIGIPALLFSIGVWVATQQSDLKTAHEALDKTMIELGKMREAVIDINNRLIRIEAQLAYIPTQLPARRQ